MRGFLVLLGALALSACAEAGPQGGVANYDSLRAAAKTCEAQGGRLVLQDQGDSQNISDYACKRK
jgi:hypothetical protein